MEIPTYPNDDLDDTAGHEDHLPCTNSGGEMCKSTTVERLRENPAFEAVCNLLNERDSALRAYEEQRKAKGKLASELAAIAESLKVPARHDAVVAKVVEARMALSENEALRRTLAEVEHDLKARAEEARDDAESSVRTVGEALELEGDDRYSLDAILDRIGILKRTVSDLMPDAVVGARGDALSSAITLLAKDIKDPGAAKNFTEMRFEWDEGVLPSMPFRKAALLFYREGGKSPAELVEEIKAENAALRNAMAALPAATAAGKVGRFVSSNVPQEHRAPGDFPFLGQAVGLRFDRIEVHCTFEEVPLLTRGGGDGYSWLTHISCRISDSRSPTPIQIFVHYRR